MTCRDTLYLKTVLCIELKCNAFEKQNYLFILFLILLKDTLFHCEANTLQFMRDKKIEKENIDGERIERAREREIQWEKKIDERGLREKEGEKER